MAAASKNHHYLVILCGGTGPRLWPLSTASQPKQFLKINSRQTLLEQTITRCLTVVPQTNLYIISNHKYAARLKKLPATVLLEPEKRNTMTAIIFAVTQIFKKDPLAIITTTPADHYIPDTGHFTSCLRNAAVEAQKGTIVTIGVSPTSPNPSYGYIKTYGPSSPFSVVRFIEKPSSALATRLIKNPQWFWNSGIYTFTIPVLKHALSIHSPRYYKIYQFIQSAKTKQEIAAIYQKSPNKSFDRVVSEHSRNMKMIPASFTWSDVGEWQAIFNILPKNQQNNALINPDTIHLALNSTSCLISASPKKLVGIIGLSNIAVIDTPQGLLICRLPLSAQVRDLVATMVSDPKTKHFFEQ